MAIKIVINNLEYEMQPDKVNVLIHEELVSISFEGPMRHFWAFLLKRDLSVSVARHIHVEYFTPRRLKEVRRNNGLDSYSKAILFCTRKSDAFLLIGTAGMDVAGVNFIVQAIESDGDLRTRSLVLISSQVSHIFEGMMGKYVIHKMR